MIEATIYGKARPEGALTIGNRSDGGRYLRHSGGQDLASWKRAIAETVGPLVTEPETGAVRVDATFYVARPKGHYGTGRNAGRLRESAPAFPTKRSGGDLDKLARGLLDALTGCAFLDDSQVTDLRMRKRYADGKPVCLDLHVRALDEAEAVFERSVSYAA